MAWQVQGSLAGLKWFETESAKDIDRATLATNHTEDVPGPKTIFWDVDDFLDRQTQPAVSRFRASGVFLCSASQSLPFK
jgi:hypothetical protein